VANFNKVVLIGRLTRDPETRSFPSGGMVAKIGFAVTNRKKNTQTGQWEDEPMFIDCEVYNRGETGKLADLVRDRCKKGSQILLEGKLHLDTWDDKNNPGQKRSKHKIVVDNIQLLDGRPADGGSYGGGGSAGGYGGGDADDMDAPASPPARSYGPPPKAIGRPPAAPPRPAPPPADDADDNPDNIPF
jgi:single-strand DNA-binding protein